MNKNQWKAVRDKLKKVIGEPPPSHKTKLPTFQFTEQEKSRAVDENEIMYRTTPASYDEFDREFINVFHQLTYRHSPWEVWNDFVIMTACTISNTVDTAHFNEREDLYLKTILKYEKSERELFPKLFDLTVDSLDNCLEQDFLGRMYMRLNLGSRNKGQFFTPYHVCEIMAEITLGNNLVDLIHKNGYISILDPCCGAGATLIAGINSAREQLSKANLNFQNHVLIVAQDIDPTVAMMCYIQISLLGVAGYVKVGDALSEPMTNGDTTENYWFTPMYFSDVWVYRRMFRKMDDMTKGESGNGRK